MPRNYLTGAGLISFNVRVARTFGFGPRRGGNGLTAGDMGGPGGPGGGPGGPGGGGRMGGGGGGGRGGAAADRAVAAACAWAAAVDAAAWVAVGGDLTEHRFNLTLSVMFNNLINHYNPGGFIGNLNSPQFGQATSINSGFGGGPGGGGGFGGSVANNRRIEFQTRLTF